MRQGDKWIITIGVVCVVAPVAYLGYFAVWAIRDLNRMEGRRPVLLYQTDHRALLEACRDLSRQVAAGKLAPGEYHVHGHPDSQVKQFPTLIVDLDPLQVCMEKNGEVNLIMSPGVMYGVCAYPDGYEGSPADLYKAGNRVFGIELADGLWYYDHDLLKHPERKQQIEELLKRRGAMDSPGVLIGD